VLNVLILVAVCAIAHTVILDMSKLQVCRTHPLQVSWVRVNGPGVLKNALRCLTCMIDTRLLRYVVLEVVFGWTSGCFQLYFCYFLGGGGTAPSPDPTRVV